VLGIGVNVTPASVPPATELNFPATSLEGELGTEVELIDLLAAILGELFTWRSRLGDPQFVHAWQERLAFRGDKVFLSQSGGAGMSGRLIGVYPDGSLRLQLADGREERVHAGEISLLPVSGSFVTAGGKAC